MKTPTTSDPRDDAFLEPAPEFAGLKLRPFSAGTLTLARALRLQVILGGAAELDEEERQAQLVTVLFMQSAPLETVLRAVKIARRSLQDFRDEILLPFELSLPVLALPAIMAELQASFVAVQNADFDTPGESSKPGSPAPGNA